MLLQQVLVLRRLHRLGCARHAVTRLGHFPCPQPALHLQRHGSRQLHPQRHLHVSRPVVIMARPHRARAASSRRSRLRAGFSCCRCLSPSSGTRQLTPALSLMTYREHVVLAPTNKRAIWSTTAPLPWSTSAHSSEYCPCFKTCSKPHLCSLPAASSPLTLRSQIRRLSPVRPRSCSVRARPAGRRAC